MMIQRVYLDLDGVLVNFQKGSFEMFGLPDGTSQIPCYNYFEPVLGKTHQQVDENCTRKFWRELEWMPDGLDILSKVYSFIHWEKVYPLTTPMPNPESWTGKHEWVIQNIPLLAKHLVITPASKGVLARWDTLLIDDKEENIQDFVEVGGHGILIPRPWNYLRILEPDMMDYLEHELSTLFGQKGTDNV